MPLIRLFLDVALFNKGPRDVPASIFLLGLVAATNLAVALALALLDVDWLEGIAQSLVGIGLLAGFLWIVLVLAHQTPRYLQTFTAALGCDTLISALALPLLVWSRWSGESRELVLTVVTLLLLWQIAIIGHVLRQALSSSYALGLGLALAYMAGSVELMDLLFSNPG
ncbi:hypothetical protein SAMN02949497_3382 [Methylomagnum ishizawai]|uniref:Yip1 domain-containing protein n=1 Tax=Methylomagnum ishizawai TaxID=1760988 RepID=A0A1Y6D568_9GAMM|nr:hypothetical protein [Methylomagnum ishizawai]SMF96003.1 hypothetical protein SAMN02949497_3382 [Methylomagnum ishizawai]